jgi:group I intron endonuclease
MYTVYIIRNRINSKKYVGETTTNLQIRWNGHKTSARQGKSKTKIARAMNKYGINNFYIEPVYYTESIEELYAIEEFLIEAWDLTNPEKGYNMLKSKHHLGTYRQKPVYQYNLDGEYIQEFKSLTEAQKITGANHISSTANKKDMYNSSKGFLWSYEKKENIEPKYYKQIHQYDLNGQYIQTFKNIDDAENAISCKKRGNHIMDCANGNRKTSNGFIWSWELKKILLKVPKIKVILQYDLNHIFINSYSSASSAEKQTNIARSNICACANKRLKSAGGFIWEYKV